MKIQVVSDLHCEFIFQEDDVTQIFSNLVHSDSPETTLVIAGDLGAPFNNDIRVEGGWDTIHGAQAVRYRRLLHYLSSSFKEVILVPGNHEYYGGNLLRTNDWLMRLEESIPDLHILYNQTLQRGNIIFICTPLWFMQQPDNNLYWKGMTDSALNKTGLTELENEGKIAAEFIGMEMLLAAERKLNSVVVSHMAPTSMSVPEQFKRSKLNVFYINEQALKEIEKRQQCRTEITWPEVWIHGHTHHSFDYIHPTGTRIVCNPYGYYQYETNPQFQHKKVIEV